MITVKEQQARPILHRRPYSNSVFHSSGLLAHSWMETVLIFMVYKYLCEIQAAAAAKRKRKKQDSHPFSATSKQSSKQTRQESESNMYVATVSTVSWLAD